MEKYDPPMALVLGERVYEFFQTGLGVAFLVFLVIAFAAWVVLPFAVFSMDGQLRTIIKEIRKTNELLTQPTNLSADCQRASELTKIDTDEFESIE